MKNYKINFLYFVLLLAFFAGCSKDESEPENNQQEETVTDIDGNVYHTVKIGDQIWMVENLKTSRYRNGDVIPYITDDNEWRNAEQGALCDYNNDENISKKYGKLYNWHAVNDSRGIAPEGWHIPTDADWMELKNYTDSNIGTSGSAAKTLAAKTDWLVSQGVGAIGNDLSKNNSTGFSALPAGIRSYNGEFSSISIKTTLWSADSYEVHGAKGGRCTSLSRDGIVSLGIGGSFFVQGCSVRCIKD